MDKVMIEEMRCDETGVRIRASYPRLAHLFDECTAFLADHGAPNFMTMTATEPNGEQFEITVRKSGHKTPADRIGELEAGREWKPIATAPKDGTVLQVAWRAEPCKEDPTGQRWEQTTARWATVLSVDVEPGYWVLAVTGDYCNDDEVNPTHWMPLPDAPKGDA